MTHRSWWAVRRVSRLLDSDEQDAILGDFRESRVPFFTALFDVTGLVARRQLAVWRDWRPWLALGGVVLPLIALVLFVSTWTVRTFHLYFWIFDNYSHIDPEMLRGTRYTLEHGSVVMLRYAGLIALWSWTSGFVLASVERRALWLNLLILGCLGAAATFAASALPLAPGPWFVFSACSALVAVPVVLGVRHGLRRRHLSVQSAWSLALVLAVLTVYGFWSGSWWRGNALHVMQISLALTLSWPAGYILTTATSRRASTNSQAAE